MKRIKKQLSIVLVLALVAIPMVVLASPPAIPLLVWGNVIIDGQPALANTRILAEIDDEEVASTIVIAEGKYFIGIPDGKANEGKDITFKVDGIISDNQLPAVNIDTIPTVNFDLAVTTTATTRSCPISNGQGIQTWNGSSWEDCTVSSCNSGYHQEGNSCAADSSGGGGGGGSTTSPPSYENAGDINKNSKVDKYDFALMMANWGKTGSNVADLNEDNKVDKYDFALLMVNWTG